MSITLAGAIVAVLTFYLFLTKARNAERLLISLFGLNLLYEGFINVGYFLIVSGQTFKVPDFLQFVMAFISVVILLYRGFDKNLCLFLLTIIISVFALVVFPLRELVRTFNGVDFINNMKYMHYPAFDLQTVKTSIRLMCFAVNGVAISKCINKEQWKIIKTKYLLAGRVVICYAWGEFILKNIFHLSITQSVIYYIFGSDTSIMTALSRNGVSVIIGFNNEPSQFAMMLYSYLIIYIISHEWEIQTRGQRYLTYSSIVLMILCGSFRPVAMLPILIILYLIAYGKPKQYIIIMMVVYSTLVLLQTLGFLDYYVTRLSRAFYFLRTGDLSIGGGEAGRLYTIFEAIHVFAKRPLFGIGPGQTFAYGFIPSMLAMTGIIGLATWYKMIFGTIGRIFRIIDRKKWLLIVSAISVSWIYTDSIAIGYSIYVIGIALEIRFSNNELRGHKNEQK